MMPKLITLARRRPSRRRGSVAEHLGGGAGVDVLAAREAVDEHRVVGQVREDAELDLRVVGRRSGACPGAATKAARMRRPSSLRIGMFCRFGSELETAARSRRRSG